MFLSTLLAETIAAAFFSGAMAVALIWDIRSFRIPNAVSLALAGGFFIYALALKPNGNIGAHVVAAAIAFAVTFGIYVKGWFGAGDTKLITAIVLWFGPSHAIQFVSATALIGGVCALLLLAAARILRAYPEMEKKWPPSLARWARRGVFPYSIPIVIAALILTPGIFFGFTAGGAAQ